MRLALALILLPLPALADPAMECSAGGAGSQVEIGDCVAATEATVMQTLDAAYGLAAANASEIDEITGREAALPALEAAQAAWTAWRDAECAYRGALFGGGSGTGIEIASCRVETGRARIAALLGP